MSDIEKLPREYPEVDSRMSFEQEQNAQDILARKGINIDWTTGTIQAKNFVGSGTGLWDVGEGTGTGPKGDPGNDGKDGKDFKYTDFTQEQLDGLQGPKGDPFVYKDFTPSQLAGLKGPPGNDGKDYDPTVLDNLDKKVEKNTADVSTNRADIAKEVVRNDEQDAALVDLQDQLDNIEIPEAELEDLVTKEEFNDHEKRNVASTAVLEAEILKVAGEVLLNYNDITILYEDKIPAIQKDIEENATAIEANTEALSGYMPLDGNSIKTGKLTLKTDDPTPMSIKTGNGTPLINVWSSGAISLEKPYSEFKNNELVTKAYVDGKVAEGGGGGSEGFPALPEYDYYYLDVAGTTSGRLTLLDSDSKRTSDLNRVRLIAFHGVDKNGKRWARDKDIVSYDRPFSGTLNLLTEEGKVIMTVASSGKPTGIVTQNYFKDAISGFCGPDNYMFDIPNSECITLPTSVSTISYPQKVYVHVTGLHF